jgi:hypothetical protein
VNDLALGAGHLTMLLMNMASDALGASSRYLR